MKREDVSILTIAILAIVVTLVVIITAPHSVKDAEIAHFSSQQELEKYLTSETQQQYYTARDVSAAQGGAATSTAESAPAPSTDKSSTHSTTNVQVEGVDEPDIIKNDGQYIYALAGQNLSIIDASNPESASIVSVITLEGYGSQFFVADNKLVTFTAAPLLYAQGGAEKIAPSTVDSVPPFYQQKSAITIYDIADKTHPTKGDTLEYDGSYLDARLIGPYVYTIVNQPLNLGDGAPLPAITYHGVESKIAATDIAYFPIHDTNYQLTTVLALNLKDEQLTRSSFLTGYAQTIYVSENNLYLAAQKYLPYEEYQRKLFEAVFLPLVDPATRAEMQNIFDDNSLSADEKDQQIQSAFENYYNALSQDEKDTLAQQLQEKQQEAQSALQKETERTVIHKISLDNDNVEYKAKGEVPGTLLNQFSLDEYNDDLRVATTSGDTWSGSALNHVYVLDSSLKTIGSLEDLAHNERIYSARFIGPRLYLVTFKQIDPLFVIDLSHPSNPEVLGELKIPGYSNYLHPYDETHIIGIGMDTDGEVQEGATNAAIPAGLKLGFFDVSDPSNPIEVSSYSIGDRGTSSDALYDHHAFLFSKDKNLLVLPVSVHESSRSNDRWAYGPLVFEGAYVFSVDTTDGFQLKAKVTHLTPSELSSLASQGDYGYAPYDAHVQRSLYIGNTLYTMSQRSIKATSLETYNDINTIPLPQQYSYGYGEGIAVDDVTTQQSRAA